MCGTFVLQQMHPSDPTTVADWELAPISILTAAENKPGDLRWFEVTQTGTAACLSALSARKRKVTAAEMFFPRSFHSDGLSVCALVPHAITPMTIANGWVLLVEHLPRLTAMASTPWAESNALRLLPGAGIMLRVFVLP